MSFVYFLCPRSDLFLNIHKGLDNFSSAIIKLLTYLCKNPLKKLIITNKVIYGLINLLNNQASNKKLLPIQSHADFKMNRNSTTLNKRLKKSATPAIQTQDARTFRGFTNASKFDYYTERIMLTTHFPPVI